MTDADIKTKLTSFGIPAALITFTADGASVEYETLEAFSTPELLKFFKSLASTHTDKAVYLTAVK